MPTHTPSSPLSSAPPADIHIRVTGGAATVKPPVQELKAILTAVWPAYESDGPLGHTRTVDGAACYLETELGELIIPTGLVRRTKAFLQGLGHTVQILKRRRLGRNHRPDADALADAASGPHYRLARVIAHRTLGQIETGGGLRERVKIIAQIIRLFPRSRIVVAAATRPPVRSLQRMLEHELGQVVSLPQGLAHRPRLAVSTYGQLAAFDFRSTHVLIIADGEAVGGKTAQFALGRFIALPKLVYALAPRGRTYDPAEALLVESIAGPVIYRDGPALAQTRVQFCRSTSLQAPATAKPPEAGLERKRSIWHHERRNHLIATLANAFATGDTGRLWEHGLMLADSDTRWMKAAGNLTGQLSAAVLVESPEHGRELLKLLPGWILLSNVPQMRPTAQTSTAAHGDPADTPASPTYPDGHIITLAYAIAHGVPADVLIRADGSSDPLRLGSFPPRASRCPARAIYLIDFDDDTDAVAQENTTWRMLDYGRRGWISLRYTGGQIGAGHEGTADRSAAAGMNTAPAKARGVDPMPVNQNTTGEKTNHDADPTTVAPANAEACGQTANARTAETADAAAISHAATASPDTSAASHRRHPHTRHPSTRNPEEERTPPRDQEAVTATGNPPTAATAIHAKRTGSTPSRPGQSQSRRNPPGGANPSCRKTPPAPKKNRSYGGDERRSAMKR